jgi:hypothetical protein
MVRAEQSSAASHAQSAEATKEMPMNQPRLFALAVLVTAGVAVRFIPHPPNFSPVAALGLFAGAHFASRRVALAVPLLILFLSDLVLGMSAITPVVYGSFALVVGLGGALRGRLNPTRTASAALLSATLFYVLTNFGVWALSDLYPHTSSGFAACYAAAIPFFRNTLAGDLFYTGLFFGTWALLERRWPVLAAEANR